MRFDWNCADNVQEADLINLCKRSVLLHLTETAATSQLMDFYLFIPRRFSRCFSLNNAMMYHQLAVVMSDPTKTEGRSPLDQLLHQELSEPGGDAGNLLQAINMIYLFHFG